MSKAIEHLRKPESQRRLDEDGCEVGVSRQAVDEAVRDFDAIAAENERLNRRLSDMTQLHNLREARLAEIEGEVKWLREWHDNWKSLAQKHDNRLAEAEQTISRAYCRLQAAMFREICGTGKSRPY